MKIKEQDLKEISYELYKMHWKRKHISLEREMATYREYELETLEYQEEFGEIITYEEWLFERGFDGELYACFDEFLDYEYQDTDYMSYLLGHNSVFWKAYKEYQKVEE